MLKALLLGKIEEEVADRSTAGEIRNLIRAGIRLKRAIRSAMKKLEEVNARLLPYAETLQRQTELSTATFRSEDGEVEVKFAEAIVWDEKDMPTIKAALGPIFSHYFLEIPSFSVNLENIPEIQKRLGKDFEQLVQRQAVYKHTSLLRDLLADGDSLAGKKLRDLIRIEAKKPSVRYEESVAAQADREAKRAEKSKSAKKPDRAA